MIESARYAESGSIIAVIDGVQMTVPDDMANRHRQMIAEWEAEGNTIEPYVPPPPTLEDYERAVQALIDATAREKNTRMASPARPTSIPQIRSGPPKRRHLWHGGTLYGPMPSPSLTRW